MQDSGYGYPTRKMEDCHRLQDLVVGDVLLYFGASHCPLTDSVTCTEFEIAPEVPVTIKV